MSSSDPVLISTAHGRKMIKAPANPIESAKYREGVTFSRNRRIAPTVPIRGAVKVSATTFARGSIVSARKYASIATTLSMARKPCSGKFAVRNGLLPGRTNSGISKQIPIECRKNALTNG